MSPTLIVAPWGNPAGWQAVSYAVEVYRDRELEPRQLGRKYKATLGALQEAFGDSRSLVLVSDTLAVGSEEAQDSYEAVKEAAMNFARGFKSADYLSCVDSTELVVLPGVGRFRRGGSGKTLEAVGSPLLYMLCAFREISKRLLEHKPDRLVLDLSHGINYMPLMAYRAVDLAACYYSLRTQKELELLVYNSDPVVNTDEAVVHLVENRRVSPTEALERAYSAAERLELPGDDLAKLFIRVPPIRAESVGQKFWEKLVGESKRLREIFSRRLSRVREASARARGVVRGARRGLPLFVAGKLTELGFAEVVEPLELLEGVEEGAVVYLEDGSVRVFHLANPRSEVFDLVLTLALDFRFREDSRSFGCRECSLGDLKNVVEKYFVDEDSKIIAESELEDVQEKIELFRKILQSLGLKPPSELPYKVIYEACELRVDEERVIDIYRRSGGESFPLEKWLESNTREIRPKLEAIMRAGESFTCKGELVDRRNFYAHAGLERHTVRVNLEKGTISYYPECLRIVEKYAANP